MAADMSNPMPSSTHLDEDMYAIHYRAPKGREPGYVVKLSRCKTIHTKWFGVAQYGSLEAALNAAMAWQNELAPQLEVLTQQEFVTLIRPNNTSGFPGVFRTVQRKKKRSGEVTQSYCWMARAPRCLTAQTRSFSVSVHGEQRAKELAIAARQVFVEMCEGIHISSRVPKALRPKTK